MKFHKYYSLALLMLGSIFSAHGIPVDKGVGKALTTLHSHLAALGSTDQLNADFMALHKGIAAGNWECAEKTYKSAIDNAREVSKPENMLCMLSKNVRQRTTNSHQNRTSQLTASLVSSVSCCGECTQITQAMLPLTIDTPGKYCFEDDLIFTPTGEEQLAITIDASDVIIDMCHHKLQQNEDAQQFLVVVGIEIIQGHKNIALKNGTICNFQGAAINAFVREEDKTTLDTICLTNLTITDNGDGASSIDGFLFGILATGINFTTDINNFPEFPSSFAYRNITVNDCKINRNAQQGLLISGAQGVTIENSQVNNTFLEQVGGPVSTIGISLFQSRNIQILNSTANGTRNATNDGFFFQTHGIFTGRSQNLFIKDSQFNDTFAESSFVLSGGDFSNARNLLCINCQFNNPTGGANEQVGFGTAMIHSLLFTRDSNIVDQGFRQEFNAEAIEFINCQFNGANRLGETPPAFATTGIISSAFIQVTQNMLFKGCQASRVTTQNPSFSAYGFLFEINRSGATTAELTALRNITFEDCIVSDIASANNTAGYFISIQNTGLALDGSIAISENIIFKNCIAENLTSQSNQALAAGIFCGIEPDPNTFGIQPIGILQNVFIQGCVIADVTGGSDESAGILLNAVKKPVICDTSITDCPNGILLTGLEGIFPVNIFQLAKNKADALAEPPVFIDILSAPNGGPAQTFQNITRGTSVNVTPSSFSVLTDTIKTQDNLNMLGWQLGDKIIYHTNGGTPIEPLINGERYSLIVYEPGFTDCGLIQNNKITNCPLTGIRDDSCPTENAFICNTAFKNGTTHIDNYAIFWEKAPPVCKGTLAKYPKCEKPFNISLIPGRDICKENT